MKQGGKGNPFKGVKDFLEKGKNAFDCAFSLSVIGICTGLGYLATYWRLEVSNALLIYLIGIAAISMLASNTLYSLFAGLFSLLLYNLLFLQPVGSLFIQDYRYSASLFLALVAVLSLNLLCHIVKKKEREVVKARGQVLEAKTKEENDRYRMLLMRSVSHDMRTPLTAIRMASSLALEDVGDREKTKELLSVIERDSAWLCHVVEKQLLLTKVETLNRDALNMELIPLEELISQGRRNLGESLEGRRVEVLTDGKAEFVWGDFTLLSSAVQNLMENAVKFTDPQKGVIAIRLSQKDGGILFDFQNDGPIIPEEDLPKLFDLYFTRSKTGDAGAMSSGTGMGLPICQAIAALHGGSVKAFNAPGGPCFELWIPGKEGERA